MGLDEKENPFESDGAFFSWLDSLVEEGIKNLDKPMTEQELEFLKQNQKGNKTNLEE